MIDRTPPAVQLPIGAERRALGSGGLYQHVNPATGQPDAEIPLTGAAEGDEAARTVPQSSEWTRYYAGWADKIHSDLNATMPVQIPGFTWEHDAHLYFRRAKSSQPFLGDEHYHHERFAALTGN